MTAVPVPERTLFGHPRGLYLLFATEAWERVQYYGMRAFLVLYLVDRVHGLGWNEARALTLYGWYTGLCYLSTVAGGWAADRVLGQRRAVVIGGTLMIFGQFLCALKQEPLLYAGGALLIVGNGLFKANISTMVGQLYRPGDPRRDGGFTIFYVGINLGAAVGPLVCGTLAEKVDWSLGFASAGLGMALGLLVFLLLRGRLLGDVGAPPRVRPRTEGRQPRAPLTREERDRIIVIFVLTFFVAIFWAGYEQGGGLMNLFTDRSLDRDFFGHEVPTTWFQAVNSMFIFLLAPVFAWLWPRLAERREGAVHRAEDGPGAARACGELRPALPRRAPGGRRREGRHGVDDRRLLLPDGGGAGAVPGRALDGDEARAEEVRLGADGGVVPLQCRGEQARRQHRGAGRGAG